MTTLKKFKPPFLHQISVCQLRFKVPLLQILCKLKGKRFPIGCQIPIKWKEMKTEPCHRHFGSILKNRFYKKLAYSCCKNFQLSISKRNCFIGKMLSISSVQIPNGVLFKTASQLLLLASCGFSLLASDVNRERRTSLSIYNERTRLESDQTLWDQLSATFISCSGKKVNVVPMKYFALDVVLEMATWRGWNIEVN